MPKKPRARSRAQTVDLSKIHAQHAGFPPGFRADEWVTAKTVQAALGNVVPATLLNYRKAGKLEFVRVTPKRILYRWDSVLRLLNSRGGGRVHE